MLGELGSLTDVLFHMYLTGNSDVFMGLDTRGWTSCVCHHFRSFLLPPAFPVKVFCRVSASKVPHKHSTIEFIKSYNQQKNNF